MTNVTVDGLVATCMKISIIEDKTLDAREAERRVFASNYLLAEFTEGTDRKQKSQDFIFIILREQLLLGSVYVEAGCPG